MRWLALAFLLTVLGIHPSASAEAPEVATPDGMRWVDGRVVDPPAAIWPKVAVAAAGTAAAGVIALRGDSSAATLSGALSATTLATGTSTTTTTTTTMPAAACEYRLSGRSTPAVFPPSGGDGTCTVATTSQCSWTARTNAGWISLGTESGQGEGTVTFRAGANAGDTRMARIVLREDAGALCEVGQEAGTPPSPRVPVTWSSELEVPGGSGQVVFDGAAAVYQLRGRARGSRLARGEVRLEAILISGEGLPGAWRFEMGGSFRPGTLRLIAGDGAPQGPNSVVFRLQGRSGERVVFAFATIP